MFESNAEVGNDLICAIGVHRYDDESLQMSSYFRLQCTEFWHAILT